MMKLCEDRRGTYKKTEYIGATRVILDYEIPLAEVIYDFYDKLKSITRGYGTMDYERHRLPRGRPGKARHPGQRRPRGCAVGHRAPRRRPRPRPEPAGPAEAGDRPAPVRDPPAGGHRRQDRRPRDHQERGQERHRQVLRRRRHAQAQAAGETEGRQKRMKPPCGSVDIPQEAFMAILESED